MRVAVLLSGQPRTWRRCVASQLALFPDHDVDFYLQAWVPAPRAELIAAYKPVECKVQIPKRISDNIAGTMVITAKSRIGPANVARARAMLYQWRAVSTAWKMIPAQDYDIFVRLRYDLLFREPLPELLEGLGENACRIPKWRDANSGLNDHLAIMGRRAAETYCGMTGFHCDRIWKPRRTHPFHFARNLEECLARGGVEVEVLAIPYLLVRQRFAQLKDYAEMAKRIREANEGATFGPLVIHNNR